MAASHEDYSRYTMVILEYGQYPLVIRKVHNLGNFSSEGRQEQQHSHYDRALLYRGLHGMR